MRQLREKEKRKQSVFVGLGDCWWSGGPVSNTVHLQIWLEAENLREKRHTWPSPLKILLCGEQAPGSDMAVSLERTQSQV